jgi:hypothetical protein
MTPNELAAAGRALYGERWQTSLARDLPFSDRTMRRWLSGKMAIPGYIEWLVRQVAVKRVKELGEIIGYWLDSSDRSVMHYPTYAVFCYDTAGNLSLVSRGMAASEDVSKLTERAKELFGTELEREKETPKRFIEKTAWWLTHSSGNPVRAPRHADRLYMSRHGWAVDFGANTFLVGKAIERCGKVLNQCRDAAARGQTVSRADVEAKLRKAISWSVANSSGDEYQGSYPVRDDYTLVFGAQGIGVDDGADFMIEESDLRWNGDVLAASTIEAAATPETPPIELPFDRVLLTRIDDLELSVRATNYLENEHIEYLGDLVQKTELQLRTIANFGGKSINDIKEALAQRGLFLGMDVPGWLCKSTRDLAKVYEAQL